MEAVLTILITAIITTVITTIVVCCIWDLNVDCHRRELHWRRQVHANHLRRIEQIVHECRSELDQGPPNENEEE